MEACALFKRVSTDHQTTDNQDDGLEGYAQEHGYAVARTFDLPDVSGSKGDKRHEAALNEVVQDMADGLYTVLVVVHSSRLDRRNEDDQIELVARVKHVGGRIESATEPAFGKTDNVGRMATLMAQMANAEFARTLSAAVKRGFRTVEKNGYFRGGRLPYGYAAKCEDCGTVNCRAHRGHKRIVTDEDARPVVTEIFERVSRGQTVTQIAAWLASEGNPKTDRSITKTVQREIYKTGRYQVTDSEGIVREHRCEPLVTPELWRAANDSLEGRTAVTGGRKGRRTPANDVYKDYSAVLRCGRCGGAAYRRFQSRGKYRHRVYHCPACPGTSWNGEATDSQVRQIMSTDTMPEYRLAVVPGSDHTAELDRVRDELRDLPARNLPDEEEDKLRAELRAERKRLEALPAVPPKRALLPTGRSMGDAWRAMGSHAERIAYLRGTDDFELVLTGHGRDVVVVKEVSEVLRGFEDKAVRIR